jgi:hypothetical protein
MTDDLGITLPGRRAPERARDPGTWSVWITWADRGLSNWATIDGRAPRFASQTEAADTAAFWNMTARGGLYSVRSDPYYEARPFTFVQSSRWGVWALNLISNEGSWTRMSAPPKGRTGPFVDLDRLPISQELITCEADAQAKADLWNQRPPKDTIYQAREWS